MVHYILANDEQKEFAEGAKEIVSKELGPHIEEYENADGGLMIRNVRIFRIFGGTNQIKCKNLAKAIAGKDPEAVRK